MTTGKSYLISIKYLFLFLIILFSSCDFNSKEKELIGIVADVSEVKLVYEQNEKLDMSGLIVTALYDDESEEVISDYKLDMNDETELKESGVYKITVFYEGFNTCFEYVVNEIIVEEELKDVIETEPIVVEKLYLNVETDFAATKDTVELYSEEFNNLKPLKVTAVSNKAGVMTFEWYITFHGGVNTTILQTTNKKVEADQTCEDSYVIKANPYMKALYTCDVKMIAGEETQTVTTVSFEQKQIMPETGLPLVQIETDDNEKVKDKTNWIKSEMHISNAENLDWNIDNLKIKIKGRGNTSWSQPKKSYSIKINDNSQVLGMKKNKKWVLVGNYSDKSLLRNLFVSEIGKNVFDNVDWNPSFRAVSFILNNEYLGVYNIGESVKISKNRINIQNISDVYKLNLSVGDCIENEFIDCNNDGVINYKDGGFLLEVNYRLDGNFNFTTRNDINITLKDPDVEDFEDSNVMPDDVNSWIKKIVQTVEDELYSENFKLDENYRQLIDVDSFIDYFLLQEFLRNYETSNFITSIFMYYSPLDERIHMGPNWDYDEAMGNNYAYNENYELCGQGKKNGYLECSRMNLLLMNIRIVGIV